MFRVACAPCLLPFTFHVRQKASNLWRLPTGVERACCTVSVTGLQQPHYMYPAVLTTKQNPSGAGIQLVPFSCQLQDDTMRGCPRKLSMWPNAARA